MGDIFWFNDELPSEGQLRKLFYNGYGEREQLGVCSLGLNYTDLR